MLFKKNQVMQIIFLVTENPLTRVSINWKANAITI